MSVEWEQAGQHARVKVSQTWLDANSVLLPLLEEYTALSSYRVLRDSLPRKLAALLKCQSILLYQRNDGTLHFVSGFFDTKEQAGWSASLLSVAHINPIDLNSDALEAQAWRNQGPVLAPAEASRPTHVAVPLFYRQREIGVLVAIRKPGSTSSTDPGLQSWHLLDIGVISCTAQVVAMLLEHTRMLERDRERIQELSLLNSMSSQFNNTSLTNGRVIANVLQRAQEIAAPDLCDLLLVGSSEESSSRIPWLSEPLCEQLFCYLAEEEERRSKVGGSLVHFVLERPGDERSHRLLEQLPSEIKTFFIFPLRFSRNAVSSHPMQSIPQPRPFVGLFIGGYYQPRKLSASEIVLLQVLVDQASAAFERVRLMSDLIEARNEARGFLRQALDDQRSKAVILESIPSGLLTVDLTGVITTFNRAASTILGYHAREMIGLPVQKLFGDILLAENGHGGSSLAVLSHHSLPVTVRSGESRFLDLSLVPLLDEQGQQIGTLITVIDITAMHKLEEEKRRLDRLASLGEMAASVAHEVRNPLASMKTTIQMLATDIQDQNQEAQESISIVLKEIERVDLIVRDLLDFARPRQMHRVEMYLPELCDRVLGLMQAQFEAAGIEVRRAYSNVLPIQADIGQMEQILFNLLTNALQAMPEGGLLTVSCQAVIIGGQEQLELVISDTGTGIVPEHRERLFQPFFTTRAHGIGLGLAITRRLVEEHQGEIIVESQYGYGTAITIHLPFSLPLSLPLDGQRIGVLEERMVGSTAQRFIGE